MEKTDLDASVEEFLFGRGLTLEDYFIRQTSWGDLLCFREADGRDFDLLMDDEEWADAAIRRLRELGVRIVIVD